MVLSQLLYLVPLPLLSFLKAFIYLHLFIYFAGSSLLWVFSGCSEWGLLSSCGAWASHGGGFFCCGAQVLGCMGFSSCSTGAQYLQLVGLVVPWHVESSWTRDQTHVPCIGRQTPNPWTTREVPTIFKNDVKKTSSAELQMPDSSIIMYPNNPILVLVFLF